MNKEESSKNIDDQEELILTNEEKVLISNISSYYHWRNLIAFFIVGLMNNYCYVLMLTAAV
jgi:hypothetical protein